MRLKNVHGFSLHTPFHLSESVIRAIIGFIYTKELSEAESWYTIYLHCQDKTTGVPMHGDLVFPLGSAIWERFEFLPYVRASPLAMLRCSLARVAGENLCTTFFENSVCPDQRDTSHI